MTDPTDTPDPATRDAAALVAGYEQMVRGMIGDAAAGRAISQAAGLTDASAAAAHVSAYLGQPGGPDVLDRIRDFAPTPRGAMGAPPSAMAELPGLLRQAAAASLAAGIIAASGKPHTVVEAVALMREVERTLTGSGGG